MQWEMEAKILGVRKTTKKTRKKKSLRPSSIPALGRSLTVQGGDTAWAKILPGRRSIQEKRPHGWGILETRTPLLHLKVLLLRALLRSMELPELGD